jgi:hypothetical protein
MICSPRKYHSGQEMKNEVDVVCGTYGALVGKPEGKRPLGRRRPRWKDNTKVNLNEVCWEGVDWIVGPSIGTSGGLLYKRP